MVVVVDRRVIEDISVGDDMYLRCCPSRLTFLWISYLVYAAVASVIFGPFLVRRWLAEADFWVGSRGSTGIDDVGGI